MTREEAIKILKAIRVYECYPKSASEETKEAIDMAIEALSQPIVCKDYRIDDDHIYCSPKMADRVVEALSEDISENGTLKVNVSDASKVKRVMVWGEKSGGLYYLDEGCDKCKYFPFSEESNVQNMHNGMVMEQAIEWCKDCQHNEVCRYYPYDGCEFKDISERPKGEWVFHASFSDELQRDDYDLICTNCGELYRCDCQDDVNDFVWNAHYCMNCGAYMGGEKGESHNGEQKKHNHKRIP